jgi:hypothetical protein
MWAIAIHSPFPCSNLPPTRHLLPIGSGYFPNQHFLYKYPAFSSPVTLHTYSPMHMEQTVCSEKLPFKLQTPMNNPEESKRQKTVL